MSSAHISRIGIPNLPVEAARRIDEACDRWEGAWLAGKPDRLQDYLATFEQALRPALLRQLLLLEWEYLHQRGERVDLVQYLDRFPDYSTLIQEVSAEHAVAMAAAEAPAAETGSMGLWRDVSSATLHASKEWEDLGYVILSPLGYGMGTVFLARHIATDRLVAVKILRGADAFDPAGLERFRCERQSLARLEHPNIVPVYDVGQFQERPFYSMEYCSGGSLAEHLRQNRPAPLDAAELVETLARAVHAAHQAQVIHRDLKPSNVLLQKNADSESNRSADASAIMRFIPKLADFGLAKALDAVTQTQTGLVVGTPQYMAPEQALGKSKEVQLSADVYSLGAILYECLAGRPPFRGATFWDTLQQVIAAEPAPLKHLYPHVPRDLETICLKCLAKEPHERYPNADALAEDLRRFQKNEPIQVRPVSALERTWKRAKRHPATATLLMVLVFCAFVGPTLAFWALAERHSAIAAFRKAKDETTRADLEKRRAEHQAVRMTYSQAILMSEQGDTAGAQLWLARGLKAAVQSGEVELECLIRKQLGALRRDIRPLQSVINHQSPLFAVAISQDGKRIATAGKDPAARVWETGMGQRLGQPLRHDDEVFAVAFSHDGKQVLTGSGDGKARLWDVDSGQQRGPLLAHEDRVLAVAISPDGETLLTGSHGTARLWEMQSGMPIRTFEHQRIVRCVAFSPDGKLIATGGDDGAAQLWNAKSGETFGKPLICKESVYAVAFSPDGKWVLTGSRGSGQLWNVATGQPATPPLQHDSWVMAVGFSPDGKIVLTASTDRTVRLWQTDTGRVIGRPLLHPNQVRAAVFSPDGQGVVTGCFDGVARLFEFAIQLPLVSPAGLKAVAFSPDGKTIATGGWDYWVRQWNMMTREPSGPQFQLQDVVVSIAYSPDGTRLLTGCQDGTAQQWNAVTGQPVGRQMKHRSCVRAVAYSPNGKIILTGSDDSTAQQWDAETGERFGSALKHVTMVTAVAFSPDGQRILTGCWDNKARQWNASTGDPIGSPAVHSYAVVALAFSPDGKTFLTGSWDMTAQLWSTATVDTVGPPLLHQKLVSSVAFSPDGTTILTGSYDDTASLWDVATGNRLGLTLQHTAPVEAVAFSHDGNSILTGCQDGTARLWHLFPPAQGNPDQIILRTQLMTGMELDESGGVRALDAATWNNRREQLDQLQRANGEESTHSSATTNE